METPPPSPQRFYPSGRNSTFMNHHASFDDYIEHSKRMLTDARLDLLPSNQATIIAANAPDQANKGQSNTGILLIHGLLDSPDSLKSVFNHYKEQGYWVRSLLLPGHGTVPGDLLDVSYQAWLAATRFGIQSFRPHVDKLILVGYSTGASLAIVAALENLPIDALVLFAPALQLNSPFAFTANWHRWVSWLIPRAKWFNKTNDTNYSKYQSIAFNGIHQVRCLMERIQTLGAHHTLTLPFRCITTATDDVVSSDAALNFFIQQRQPHSAMLIYGHKPSQSHPRVSYRSAAYPDAKILNFSHTCLATSPDHPHYGKHQPLDLAHYGAPWGRPFKKHQPTSPTHNNAYAGAITYDNLYHYYPLSRLGYNPDFSQMMQWIDTIL